MNSLSFFVPGRPVPGGSKRAFIMHRKGCPAGRRLAKGPCVCHPYTQVTDDAGQRNKEWRSSVAQFSYEALKHSACEIMPPFSGAVDFSCHFWLPRPKHHYGKGGFLLPSSPHYHITKPDTLKLARAVEDALTGIVWTDDSIIVLEHLSKDYATRHNIAGALIEIKALDEPQKLIDFKEPNERPKRSYTLRDPREQNIPTAP